MANLPLISLYLSERCNSRCITCDYWKHGERDLSVATVERMLPSLTTLGTRTVLFSGGEPLLNPKWREIAMLLKGHGLDLWLLTSGLSLGKHASQIEELFGSVTVSLDGTDRETYAAIRGLDAFDKVCAGIDRMSATGIPTNVRVTLQRDNFRQLPEFVRLAKELGAIQVSFLAVDVSNPHAFGNRNGTISPLALRESDVAELRLLIDELERANPTDFANGFIAESPEKLRRICDYFAALCGQGAFPPVRCNAPEFSAVVGADGRVSPCFFIPPADRLTSGPDLVRAWERGSGRRAEIRNGERPECKSCVCPLWRDPSALRDQAFSVRVRRSA